MKTLAILIALCMLVACKSDILVAHPDAPMLIIESKGRARVAVYDKETKSLVDLGWVEVPEGWTVSKYDWSRVTEER